MSKMVERVARAIIVELAPLHMDSVLSQKLEVKDRPLLPNGRALQVARAAIEAMRPLPEALWRDGGTLDPDVIDYDRDPETYWHAIIDAALKD